MSINFQIHFERIFFLLDKISLKREFWQKINLALTITLGMRFLSFIEKIQFFWFSYILDFIIYKIRKIK